MAERTRTILILLALLFVVAIVQAVPTTQAVTKIGNNNMTFNGNGVTGTIGWFQWGMADGQTWAHTPNVTATAGVITYTMRGSPMFGSTKYYVKACDPTGCGLQVDATTLPVTPLPTTTYGQWAQNITEMRLEPANAVWNSLQPYMAVTGATVFYGIIFAMVFVGIWLRTRGTAVAQQLGMICMALFGSTLVGLQLGLPPEFLAVGQALLYVSLAGTIVSFTVK